MLSYLGSAEWGIGYRVSPPETINVTLLLFTRSNPQVPESVHWVHLRSGVDRLSFFNPSLPSKVIIHGYHETLHGRWKDWMYAMKDAFLGTADVNVILVDWSGGNQEPYSTAVGNGRIAGQAIAQHLHYLRQWKGGHLADYHLIGHSLGAHVAGFTGKALGGRVGQITGLDPAGPLFRLAPPEDRLWYTDARFVDVLHTDAKGLLAIGLAEPCGTVDIYPNGAQGQPGCVADRFTAFWTGGWYKGMAWILGCEHYRSWMYYTEAILQGGGHAHNLGLLAYGCEDWETFEKKESASCHSCGPRGENCVYLGPRAAEYSGQGRGVNRKKFYLTTQSKEPYFAVD